MAGSIIPGEQVARLALGLTTPDPNSLKSSPDLQKQDDGKFQVAEQVAKGPLRLTCRWMPSWVPTGSLSMAFSCSPGLRPPARPHQGHLFTTTTSLVRG